MARKTRKRKTLKADPNTYPRFYKTKKSGWRVKTGPKAKVKRSKHPRELGLTRYRDKSGHTRSAKTGRIITSRGATKRRARPSELAQRIAQHLADETGTSWDYRTVRGNSVDMEPHGDQGDQKMPRLSKTHGKKWVMQMAFEADDVTEVFWANLFAAFDAMASDRKLERDVGTEVPTFIACTFIEERSGLESWLNLSSATRWYDSIRDARDRCEEYGLRYEVTNVQELFFTFIR